MNRSELIKTVARDTGVTPQTADKMMDSLTRLITLSLVCGEDVLIWNFGKFAVLRKLETKRRNPKTGEPVAVPARRTVAFRPSPALKERLNGKAEG